MSRLIKENKALCELSLTCPHDEAYRLILCRSYDIKLQKTGRFGAKCTKFIPFA